MQAHRFAMLERFVNAFLCFVHHEVLARRYAIDACTFTAVSYMRVRAAWSATSTTRSVLQPQLQVQLNSSELICAWYHALSKAFEVLYSHHTTR